VLAGNRAGRLRLAQKALHHAAALRVLFVQKLQCKVPAHHDVARFVDAAHPSAGEAPQDEVLTVHQLTDAPVRLRIGGLVCVWNS
jgi:hypothetical protein